MSSYLLHLLTMAAVLTPVLVGLAATTGSGGLPLLCAGAYVCVGAYTYAVLQAVAGTALAAAAAPAMACLVAVLSGFAFVRMKKDDFVMATVALQALVTALVMNGGRLTGGSAGLSDVAPLPAGTLPWAAACAAGALCGFVWLSRTRFGLDIIALRDDERAAAAIGIRPVATRLALLGLCGLLAGTTGVLYASQIGFIDPTSFSFELSITLFAAILLGGRGTWAGALAGSVLTIGLPELLRFSGIQSSHAAAYHQMFYGLCLLLVVRLRPGGLFGGGR